MRLLFTTPDTGLSKILAEAGHDVRALKYYPSFPTLRQMLAAVHPFVPDRIVHVQPELVGLPLDYLDSPIPLLHVITDYHINLQGLFLAAPWLQAVLLPAPELVEFLRSAGVARVAWEQVALDPDLPIYPWQAERPVDVMFVGTVDAETYPERSAYLQMLLELLPEYDVRIVGGKHKETCSELYARSKIVFNQATLDGVLTQRTLEALAAGALLMVNEENQGALDWLSNGKDTVSYNRTNLIHRIRHYLENPEKRLSVAREGQKKFLAFQKSFGRDRQGLVSFLTAETSRPDADPGSRIRCFSSGLFRDPLPGLPPFLDAPAILLNNLGVAYWICSTNPLAPAHSRKQSAERAALYFRSALSKSPDFLPALWNFGVFSFLSNDYNASSLWLKKALLLLQEGAPWPFEARILSFYGMLDPFTRRLSQAFYKERVRSQTPADQVRQILLDGIFIYRVEEATRHRRFEEAEKLLDEWKSLGPTPTHSWEWVQAALLQHRSEKACVEALAGLLARQPLRFTVEFLKKCAYKFWSLGMSDAASVTVKHLLRRCLAAGAEDPERKNMEACLRHPDDSTCALEGLALLEDLHEVPDFLSYAP